MTSRRVDQLLLALGVLLILISAFELFYPRDLKGNGKVLGELAFTSSVVKTKHPLTLDWRDAYLGAQVMEDQLLYTDQDSHAQVKFTNGDELKVEENSLIRIKQAGENAGVSVDKGFISARLKGGQPFAVELNGEEYVLTSKDAEVQINWQKGKGEIGVMNGDVSVAHGAIKENLNPQSAMALEGKDAKKITIAFKTLSPKFNEIKGTIEPTLKVQFSWQPVSTAELTLIHLNTGKTQNQMGEGGLELDLVPGRYQWSVSSELGRSVSSQFRVMEEKPIKVIRPLSGEKMTFNEGETLPVRLQWEGGAKLYLLEMKLNEELVSKNVSAPQYLLAIDKATQLEWRVKLADENRPLSQWSSWQEVQISMVPLPLLPQDLSPHEIEYQLYQKKPEVIHFSWSHSEKVEREIKKPDGTIQKDILIGSENDWETALPGQYHWRLRSINEQGKASHWSDWKSFELTDLSSESADGFQRIQLKRPDQEVDFSWENNPGTSSVFELSKDRNFKEIIHRKETKGGSTLVAVPKVGTYFWRTRLYSPDGTVQVGEPKRVIIEPIKAPSKPEKLPNLKLPLEWEAKKNKTTFKWWHLFLAPAYADDLQGVVKINLPKDDNAKKYHLRIYRQDDLEAPVLEKEISDHHFVWHGARPGNYVWQYAVVDYWERKSPYSDLANLTIINQGPSRPKLLSPIRAREISKEGMNFKWSPSQHAKDYLFEISQDKNFSQTLHQEAIKESQITLQKDLKPNLYYWRVRARDEVGGETSSNVGRFTIAEDNIILPRALAHQQLPFASRVFIFWAPSQDTYSFKDQNQDGEISGTALMGLGIKANWLKEKWIFGAEGLRQSGKVFKKEDYLYQKLAVDGGWKMNFHRQLVSVGLGVAQISAQTYRITNGVVKGASSSSFNLGPVIKGFHPLGESWQLQSVISYLTGSNPELKLGGDFIHRLGQYDFLVGTSFQSRSYSQSSGKQTSLGFNLGIGKEF